MVNVIVLAAYWNESDWIVPSLRQLDLLNPKEVLISEGCFDPLYPIHSTDGTREALETYVNHSAVARLIEPVRTSVWTAIFKMWKGHNRLARSHRVLPSRLRTAFGMVRWAAYRRNQALTFNRMIGLARTWEPGTWFMTYDADQYYSDEMMEAFSMIRDEAREGLLTGRELTFLEGFESFTRGYESRTFNNMPHKVFGTTTIIPTRRVVLEGSLERRLYVDCVKSEDVGFYFHYRFRNPDRERLTYQVGDRRRRDASGFAFEAFQGRHPAVIREHFGL